MSQNSESRNLFEQLQTSLAPNLEQIDIFLPSFFSVDTSDVQNTDSNIDYLNNEVYKSNRLELMKKSNDFFLELFKNLNLQIIDGSYIEKEFINSLTELKSYTNQLKALFADYFDSFLEDTIFQSFKFEFEKAVIAINYLKNICSNLLYNDNQITYSLTTSLSETFENSIITNNWELSSIEILSYNIYLIKTDHYLNINDELLISNLEGIYSKSKKLKLKSFDDDGYLSICKIIFSKSNFLKKKVLLRRSEEVLSGKGKLYIQSKNDFKEFSSEDILNSPNTEEFKPWLSYILDHYGLHEEYALNIESIAIKNKLTYPIEKCSLKDIHLNIKYNKDVLSLESLDTAIDNLMGIKKYLVKLLTKSKKKSFNEYCFRTNATYCYNNIMSLLNENDRGDELLKLYEEFKSNTRLNNRKNYFATGVVLSHYAKELKSIFSKENISSEISRCSNILSQCNELINLYNVEQKWFKNHNNYIYLLPVDESKVQIDGLDVYLFSSISLPTSANYLTSKFEKPVDEIKFYQTSFKSIDSIKSSLSTVEDLSSSLSVLEKKLADKDTRTLELVALIGALLSFIAGSIPGFQFINTGLEALWFTVALGTSLSFFIFLLYFLNRGLDFVKKGWWVILIYFSCIIGTWSILYNSSDKYTEQKFDKTQIKEYIDSLGNLILFEGVKDSQLKIDDSLEINSNSITPNLNSKE